jgi:hypothetical protein
LFEPFAGALQRPDLVFSSPPASDDSMRARRTRMARAT